MRNHREKAVVFLTQDNASYTHWPPLGPMYLRAAVHRRGYATHVVSQDVMHWTDAETVGVIRRLAPDVLAMSWTAGPVPHARALAIAADVPKEIAIVAGGHGPSGGAEWYRAHLRGGVGVEVVEGYGESEQLGISADIDADDYEAPEVLEGWPVDHYTMVRAPRCEPTDRVWPVLAGRGCPGRCSFCYRLARGYRARDMARVAAEIRWLRRRHAITYVQLQDECALSTRARSRAVASMMASTGISRWSTQGRVTALASGPVLARELAASGCVFVNLGIESMLDAVVRLLGKRHTAEQSEAAVRYLREAGVSPGINIIWPLPGDTVDSLWAAVAFISAHADDAQMRTIRPPTPWPGTALWEQREKGQEKKKDLESFYDDYRNSDLCCESYLDGASPEEVDRHLLRANRQLISEYHRRACDTALRDADHLYTARPRDWRGWRRI